MDKVLVGFLAGLIQGVTEWLPVSSKTLLFFLYYASSLPPADSYALSIILNGSSGVASTIYFRRRVVRMVKALPGLLSPSGEDEDRNALKFLIVSSSLTALVGIPLSSAPLAILGEVGAGGVLVFVGSLLMLMALLNLWRTRMSRRERKLAEVNIKDALLAGLVQSLSVLPGISRSGITLLALTARGFNIEDALTLSFLMSIPATIGGSAYMYLSYPSSPENFGLLEIAVPTATAIILSLTIISTMLKLSRMFRAHYFLAGLALMTILSGILVG